MAMGLRMSFLPARLLRYWPMLASAGSLFAAAGLARAVRTDAHPPALMVGLALLVVVSLRTQAPAGTPSPWRLASLFLPGQVVAAAIAIGGGRFLWGWTWESLLFLPIWIGLTLLSLLGLLPVSAGILRCRRAAAVVAGQLLNLARWSSRLLHRRLACGDDTAASGAFVAGAATFLVGRLNPTLPIDGTVILMAGSVWLALDRLPWKRWQAAASGRSRLARFFARWAAWVVAAGLAAASDGALRRADGAAVLVIAAGLAGYGLSHRHRLVFGAENAARTLLAAGALILVLPFAGHRVLGSQDAVWYLNTLADFLAQVHAGAFPVFVGQSEHLFNGGVLPVRFAPLYQHYGLLLDCLTLRTLTPAAIHNGVIMAAFFGAAVTAIATLSRILPGRPWAAAGLSALFLTCPGVLAVVYYEDLIMTWTTLPWLPVVFGACALSLSSSRVGLHVAMGAALGLVWWGHAPVAMWTTLAAALIKGIHLATTPRRQWPVGALLSAGFVFGGIACYPMVSVLAVPVATASASLSYAETNAGAIVHFVQDCFPQILAPLPFKARSLADFQPGWALIALLVLAMVALYRRRTDQPGLWAMIAVPWGLLLLLLPVPGLIGALWSLVPGFILNPTGQWPMQRLYVVIAACGVVAVGGILARLRERRLVVTWLGLIAIGLAWSAFCTSPLLLAKNRGRRLAIHTPDPSAPENHVLTRYAYLVFGQQPGYYSHGHVDPLFEQRFLAAGDGRWIGGNPNAILNDPAVTRQVAAGEIQANPLGAGQPWQLEPRFRLEPHRRFALVFQPDALDAPGVLLLNGAGFGRIYALPSYGEERAFGSGPASSPLLSLRTSRPEAIEVSLQFAPEKDPGRTDPFRIGSYRFLEVKTAALPINVTGWIPYRAEVDAPPGAWLETPRMYQPGYRALVDGRMVETIRSPEGLVAVPVPTGRSTVVVTYQPPPLLALSYGISLLAIVGTALAGLRWSWRRPTADA